MHPFKILEKGGYQDFSILICIIGEPIGKYTENEKRIAVITGDLQIVSIYDNHRPCQTLEIGGSYLYRCHNF